MWPQGFKSRARAHQAVVEFPFLLSRSISTNRWEAAHCQPACHSPAAPDRSAGWGAGVQQGLRGKPGTEKKRGAGKRECKGERMQKRRKQRSREQRERKRGNHTLGLKTSCTFFILCPKEGVTVSAVFWGNPRVELNHHTGRHARVCQGGYKHRRWHQLVWARLKVSFTLYVMFIYFINITAVSIVMKLTS